jgi:DNA-directed RNA polymerase III subunit Rpc31
MAGRGRGRGRGGSVKPKGPPSVQMQPRKYGNALSSASTAMANPSGATTNANPAPAMTSTATTAAGMTIAQGFATTKSTPKALYPLANVSLPMPKSLYQKPSSSEALDLLNIAKNFSKLVSSSLYALRIAHTSDGIRQYFVVFLLIVGSIIGIQRYSDRYKEAQGGSASSAAPALQAIQSPSFVFPDELQSLLHQQQRRMTSAFSAKKAFVNSSVMKDVLMGDLFSTLLLQEESSGKKEGVLSAASDEEEAGDAEDDTEEAFLEDEENDYNDAYFDPGDDYLDEDDNEVW